MPAKAALLERALAESVQFEIQHRGGRRVSAKSITDYMAHRDLLSDYFWTAWDDAVSTIREAYVDHVGNIRQGDAY